MKNRGDFLDEAKRLVNGARNKAHGDPLENHQRIAGIWSVILGVEISAYQASLMMVGLKLARASYAPIDDTFTDMCGYSAISGEISHREERPL
jgi:hypothetical protein